MLNILTGACIAVTYAVVGFFTVLRFLAIFPNLYRSVQEKRKNDPLNLVPFVIFIFVCSSIISLFGWFGQYKSEWAFYSLYTLLVLAGTNLISGFYEIGRWKRNQKTGEAEVRKDKVIEAAKEAPVSLDSLGSLLTEVDALPPGISEEKVGELLVKISAAHARGELSKQEFNSLSRMVYRRIISA